jgi:hypothetical protein
MFNTSTEEWAQFIFGQSNLGDTRRTNRLVKLATDLASDSGNNVTQSCPDPASIEGAYRFIRNKAVLPEKIAESGYKRTDALVLQRPLVLAVQDTTGLSYRHSVCNELGNASSAKKSSKTSKGRSIFVHSTLMIDAETEHVIGLANQDYWIRDEKNEDKKEILQNRSIENKESYKWQRSIETLSNRIGCLSNILDVCDREADIYEYLDHQLTQGNRFLVRASDNRCLVEPKGKLKTLVEEQSAQSHYKLDIKQKGGRKARKATIALSYQSITLKKPKRVEGSPTLTVNMIICQEVDNSDNKNKLCWILYTTGPVSSVEEARKIVRFYELRWRVEEFHKVWKSDGTGIEAQRMQSRSNMQRIAVIQAFIAVRLMQLQEVAQNKESAKDASCDTLLSSLSWRILWKKTEKEKGLPKVVPSLYWAYYAIAKLGGWYDSKRTGRVGVKALWKGWLKLMLLVESYEMIKEIDINL